MRRKQRKTSNTVYGERLNGSLIYNNSPCYSDTENRLKNIAIKKSGEINKIYYKKTVSWTEKIKRLFTR